MKATYIFFLLAPIAAFGQGSNAFRESSVQHAAHGEWTGPKLPDGQPDVSGFWSNTIGNHNNLTDPQGNTGADDDAPPGRGNNNRRDRAKSEKAPSRISDPPDGQIPLQPWARAKQQEFQKHLNNL